MNRVDFKTLAEALQASFEYSPDPLLQALAERALRRLRLETEVGIGDDSFNVTTNWDGEEWITTVTERDGCGCLTGRSGYINADTPLGAAINHERVSGDPIAVLNGDFPW